VSSVDLNAAMLPRCHAAMLPCCHASAGIKRNLTRSPPPLTFYCHHTQTMAASLSMSVVSNTVTPVNPMDPCSGLGCSNQAALYLPLGACFLHETNGGILEGSCMCRPGLDGKLGSMESLLY
jgi:hypothetical protein